MDQAFDARLSRLMERLRARAAGKAPLDHDRERRQLRAEVLAALPRFLALLSGAVTETNDRLSELGLWLTLKAADRSSTAEAVFTVAVEDAFGPGEPTLAITVDSAGRVAFLLQREDKRSLLRGSSLFTANHTIIALALVDFLEARYPAP